MSTPLPPQLRFPVEAPPAQPRPYGLLSVAVEGAGSPAGDPAPWERGVDYYSPLCQMDTGSLEGWCPTTDKDITPYDPVRVEGAPFTVTSGSFCTAPGFDAEQAALDQLRRGENFRAERIFWDEQMSRADLVDLQDGPMACMVGALEAHAAEHYGANPVMHVPMILLPHMFEMRLLVADGNRLVTPWGTPVAAGAGYPNPDLTEEGFAQILMTGQVTYWRTQPIVNSDFNPRNNQSTAVAERTYVITADCLAVTATVEVCILPPSEGA